MFAGRMGRLRVAGVVVVALLALGLFEASAAAAAPPAPPFKQCPPIGVDTSCALLIYATPTGQLGIAGDPTQQPYITEDTLIGVQNESSQPISTIPLASSTGKKLFEFDSDGLCTVSNAPAGCPFGPTGYEGPGVSFSGISANFQSGTVQFSPVIPPGGSAYFSLEEALSTVPPYDFNTGATYVALGDSYSSGEGNSPYGWNSDLTSSNHCDRSLTAAYGPLVDAFASLGPMAFVACSGAITDDLFNPNNEGNLDPSGAPEPPQFASLTPSTQTVTLTIGGDDAGFVTVLEHCVLVAVGPFNFGPGDCLRDPTLAKETVARIEALAGKRAATTPSGVPIHSISSVLAAIHKAAPNAHVYIAGYPLLFPTPGFFGRGNCKVGTVVVKNAPLHLSGAHDAIVKYPDQRDLEAVGLAANAIIASAARSAGSWATYVDPVKRWENHNFCGSKTLWFHELFAEFDYKTSKIVSEDVASLHPNQGGQLEGYAEAFLEAGI